MKTILIALLFSITVFAQDGYNQTPEFYAQIQRETNNLEDWQMRDLTNHLVSKMDVSYSYVKTLRKDNGTVITYELLTLESEWSSRNNATGLIFWFDADNTLQKIQGQLIAIIDIWRRWFLCSSENEIMNNYKYRLLVSQEINLHYQLAESGFWEIQNRSKN